MLSQKEVNLAIEHAIRTAVIPLRLQIDLIKAQLFIEVKKLQKKLGIIANESETNSKKTNADLEETKLRVSRLQKTMAILTDEHSSPAQIGSKFAKTTTNFLQREQTNTKLSIQPDQKSMNFYSRDEAYTSRIEKSPSFGNQSFSFGRESDSQTIYGPPMPSNDQRKSRRNYLEGLSTKDFRNIPNLPILDRDVDYIHLRTSYNYS